MNMTPMIDVVFLLIIFFLVSGHLARRENRQAVDLASSESGSTVDPERAPIAITINAEGAIYVGDQRVAKEEITERLRQRIEPSADEVPPIRLRVDRLLPFVSVREVLSELTRGGFPEVSLSTRPGEDR
ncbi:MAG: biopolymer transporter ExbD [Planctomycetota bacterium]